VDGILQHICTNIYVKYYQTEVMNFNEETNRKLVKQVSKKRLQLPK